MSVLRVIIVLGLLGASSCTYFENKAAQWKRNSQKPSKDKRMGEAKLIGVVELVNPEQNYVLINCEQRLNIPAGTEIVSQTPAGGKARLKVTPERKGNYITADILEGSPQVRDLVLYQIKDGDLPASSAVAADGTPAVPLTPVMQADVIPPLDAPFQPLAPATPTPALPPPLPVAQPPVAPPRAMPVPEEPVADPSKLPPVIR